MMMQLNSLSRKLDELTQPGHPHYFKVQLAMLSSLTFISTACLTSISPIRGTAFIALALSISRYAAPIFAGQLEEYRHAALVPLAAQITQLTASFLLSKVICSLAGLHLTFQQTCRVGTVFLLSVFIAHFAVIKFRNSIALRADHL